MRRLVSAAVLLTLGGILAAQPPGQPSIASDTLARSQEWTQVMLQDLDLLLQNVRQEVRDPRRRQRLIQQTDDLLGDVLVFQRMLRPGVGPGPLLKRYRDIDRKLEGLLADLAQTPPQQGGLSFTNRRLHFTHNRLHQLMASLHDAPDGLPGGSLVRYARLLQQEVRDLDEAVGRAFPASPWAAPLRQQIGQLQRELEHFREAAVHDADYKHLRKDYHAVDRAWDQVDLSLYQLGLHRNGQVQAVWRQAKAQHDALSSLLHLDESSEGKTLDRLQGTWVLVTLYDGGVPTDVNEYGQKRFTFKGNTFVVTENNQFVNAGKFHVTDGQGPTKRLDLTITRGHGAGRQLEAIFALRDNHLFYAAGESRPTHFGQNQYSVWRRAGER